MNFCSAKTLKKILGISYNAETMIVDIMQKIQRQNYWHMDIAITKS